MDRSSSSSSSPPARKENIYGGGVRGIQSDPSKDRGKTKKMRVMGGEHRFCFLSVPQRASSRSWDALIEWSPKTRGQARAHHFVPPRHAPRTRRQWRDSSEGSLMARGNFPTARGTPPRSQSAPPGPTRIDSAAQDRTQKDRTPHLRCRIVLCV